MNNSQDDAGPSFTIKFKGCFSLNLHVSEYVCNDGDYTQKIELK